MEKKYCVEYGCEYYKEDNHFKCSECKNNYYVSTALGLKKKWRRQIVEGGIKWVKEW